MTVRTFLVTGLLVGLVAGVLTFAVANLFGEPSIDTAIGIEEANSAAAEAPAADDGHTHADGEEAGGHSHGDEEGGISRTTQKTWGLATAMVVVGPALGGLVGIAAAFAMGRLRRLSPAQSTALVALLGFVAVALVPFAKYPSTPPAVGSGDTIGSRTGLYFGFLLVSVVAMIGAVLLGKMLLGRLRTTEAVAAAAAAYLLVVVVVGHLMPTVNELGSFPADTLWYFRRASLVTLATLWALIGVGMTAMVARQHEKATMAHAKRELAASL
ncbi:Probable cobalt transporter subunit (CbtA) [Nocardioides exalbidus]|uniref:Probable cobalt transporter subunit (CbtA) n=1 Tax=Nocardioides exalbidus TaxID=402596 RepID=A0A1H4M6K0_9ACTN|nr:CbtA family protein [Nocardioides exalbidus]SEB78701.1 Probable cobalt transporter subunit (CbtA) [Nocardioides exalbidus]